MARNGDVMRSDRLKQVMQQIDPNFDERNAGFNRFSKFVVEAGQRGRASGDQARQRPVRGGAGHRAGDCVAARGGSGTVPGAHRRGSGARAA